MEYTITICYRWLMTTKNKKEIVKIYNIEGFPFSFDQLSEIYRNDPEIVKEASDRMAIRIEQMNRWSNYLIAEEAHPFFFKLNLKNPEELPAI
jgi:hypothetical protein